MADAPKIDTKEYVISHIDEAIETGWIKVFYQPVIRAITKQLCSVESLARWIDPEIGFLSPDKFIGVLEENRLIHKLDCFIVEQVCRDISERMEKDLPVVPVSVNFSRLDFQMRDMLEVVETNVRKCNIPRDFLHVEITESMIASDEELMSKIITDFRDAGYEIWMDDFGSGYSSLNLLKDYQFDLLKMDMRFLSSFSDKARSIVRSAITLAKNINVRTLAEGVETEEQFNFLWETGCGRIQGYFFGKPEPKDDMFAHIKEKGIEVERRQWRHFYDVASFAVKDTEAPLELMLDDGKNFKTLFMNKAYREQINIPVEIGYDSIDKFIYQTGSPLIKKYRQFAAILETSRDVETFYYTAGSNYLCFKGQVIAVQNGCYLIKATIQNITLDENTKEKERLDSKLRDLNLQFELVFLLNLGNNSIDPLIGRNRIIEENKNFFDNLERAAKGFAEHYIYPEEKEDFLKFLDLSTLTDRVTNNQDGFIEGAFRIRELGGNYEWKDVIIVPVLKTGGQEFLICMKPLLKELRIKNKTDEYQEYRSVMGHRYTVLCENLLWNCSIKFFWKDKKRRFLGVSKSFLDFYGIASKKDILGKTDEEMHWHIDDQPYMDDELDIVEKGIRVSGVPGQCIVNGVVHNIVCSKMPIYDDGEIVGLVGYFVDIEEEIERLQHNSAAPRVDTVTKLMNARSFMDALVGYAMQYAEKKRNFGLIVVNNRNHDRIRRSYGEEVLNKSLYEIGRRIIGVTGQTCAVARNKEAIFAILVYTDNYPALEKLAMNIKNAIEHIREIDGNSVTISLDVAYKLRSDEGITDENIYNMVLEELLGNK